MARLTKRTVEAAEVTGKDYTIADGELPGFALRVLPSGRKLFVQQYRFGTKFRRLTLGQYPILNPEQARIKATKVLAAIRDGQDPVAEKQAADQVPPVREVAQRFQEQHCAPHLKPASQKRYDDLLRLHILPAIGHLKVTEVTRTDIANLHHAMAKRPINANRALALLSKMFNLTELWGLRPDASNPCRHLKKYKENKRERFLTVDEIGRLGEALRMAEEAKLCSRYAVAAFRLLILTGARHSEIQLCKWEYVDLNRGIIRLPESKTGAKFIHLGRVAVELLRQLPRVEGNPYVICSDHKLDEPIAYLESAWRKLCKWAGIEGVRIHDLRHTFASNAVAMGMSLPMIGRLLGHTQTQTTARYAHLAIDPVLEAASMVAGELGPMLALPAPNDSKIIDVEAVPVEPPQPTDLALKLEISVAGELPNFLTSEEAAKYLNVKPRLMDDWRWRKKGPKFVKVGNSVRYTRKALDTFVSGNAA